MKNISTYPLTLGIMCDEKYLYLCLLLAVFLHGNLMLFSSLKVFWLKASWFCSLIKVFWCWSRKNVCDERQEHSGVPCMSASFDTLGPEQHGRLFTDNFFKLIFLNEDYYISIHISLKFIPKDLIDNKWSFVYIMAWCRIGNKPLPELMMPYFDDTYMCHPDSML